MNRRWLLTAFCLTFSACTLVPVERQYGRVVFDGRDVYDTGTEVRLPENAPSIVQRYSPQAPGEPRKPNASDHRGFDVTGQRGAPVLAAAPGTVVASYREPMYGNRVVIDHGGDGNGGRYLTRYFHLKKRVVEKGETVKRGQKIAELGSTGALAPNIHLHFETQLDPASGRMLPLNPHLFWWDGKGNVTCFDKRREYATETFLITYPAPCLNIPWQ